MAYAVKLWLVSFAFSFSVFAEPIAATSYDHRLKKVFSNDRIAQPFSMEKSHFQSNDVLQNLASIPNEDGKNTLSMDLYDFLDIDRFFRLNEDVAKAWSRYQWECSGANLNRAIENFRKPKRCKYAKRFIRSARLDVKRFLIEGNFKTFKHSDHYRCSTNDGSSVPLENCGNYPNWEEFADNIVLGNIYEPIPQLATLNETSKTLFNSLSLPPVHPLLFQLVLEALAEGFPLPFAANSTANPGMYVGSDGMNWGGGAKMVLGSRHWGFERNLSFELIKDEDMSALDGGLSQFAHELISTNQIPSIDRSFELFKLDENPSYSALIPEMVDKLRLGFAADRLIPMITYLLQNQQSWGLWPEASQRLLALFQINHYQPGGEESPRITSFAKLIVDNRLASIEPVKLEQIKEQVHKFTITFGSTKHIGGACQKMELAVGSCDRNSIDLLRDVGAWRKLWHMQ